MNGACNGNFFFAQPPGALGRGQKVKYHLISITKSISKIFIPNCVFVFSQMKDTKYIRRDFHSVTWVMPQGWDLGHWGAQGVKKLFFSNMVMWHIKSTGMTSRTELM